MYILFLVIYIAYFTVFKVIFTDYFIYEPKIILSGSMVPNINVYDVVIINKKSKEFQEGDIITFNVNNQYVTHRVVGFEKPEKIITKGDANEYTDSINLRKEDLYGKVIVTIPNIGYFFLLLGTVNGKIGFSLFILDLILLDSFIKLIKNEFKRKGEEI